MAAQFAERAFRSRSKTFAGFTPDAEQAIRGYNWPGNVRELLNVIERTALIWDGHGSITPKGLGIPSGGGVGGTTTTTNGAVPTSGRLELVKSPLDEQHDNGGSYTDLKKKWCDAFEREYLTAILARHGGNVSAAARDAKLDRSNFLRLLRRHQLKAQEYRKVA